METPDRSLYVDLVRRALAAAVGAGDITTDATVPSEMRARGVLVVKADCVLAGLEVAFEAFRQASENGPHPVFTVRQHDGAACRA